MKKKLEDNQQTRVVKKKAKYKILSSIQNGNIINYLIYYYFFYGLKLADYESI